MRTAISTITIVLTVMLLSTPVILAQDTADGDGIIEPGENPEEELGKAAQNPVADMISLPFQNTTNLGILLEPREDTRFGISYRSKVDLEFKDVASLKNIGPVLQGILNLSGLAGSKVDVDMTVPQLVMASGYHQLSDRWAVMGNIGWQDWSEFGKQDLTLRSTTSTTFTQDLNYDDTWHFALGAQYRFAERWLWSVGAAYDTSSTDEDTRTPDLPHSRQAKEISF